MMPNFFLNTDELSTRYVTSRTPNLLRKLHRPQWCGRKPPSTRDISTPALVVPAYPRLAVGWIRRA